MVLRLEAEIGLVPQSATKDTSDFSRSVFPPAVINSCAAVTVPIPVVVDLKRQLLEIGLQYVDFRGEVLVPSGQRFQRHDCAGVGMFYSDAGLVQAKAGTTPCRRYFGTGPESARVR